MTWRVAIPTYQRADLLTKRTLPTLLNNGVPADLITVYAGDDDTYNLPAGVQLRRVPPGLAAASNAITDDHDEGAHVVRCDDDLRQVVRLTLDDRLGFVVNVAHLFDRAFEAMENERVSLWGVGPVANAYFMRHDWSVGLWFAIGTLHGFANRRSFRSTLPVKNDYERTLQHYTAAGGVLRLRDISFKAEPMRRTAGGLQADLHARRERETAAVASLIQRWPGLVHPKKARDGFPEIALRLPKRS